MGIKEKNLPSAAGVSGADYMREVTSGGLSYKALVSDVAKYIVENYAGSNIAGSSQSIKTALDNIYADIGDEKIHETTYSVTTAGIDITIRNNFRGYMWILDSSTNGLGLYFVLATGAGAVTVVAIVDATKLTHTETTNNLNLKSSSGTLRCLLTDVTT